MHMPHAIVVKQSINQRRIRPSSHLYSHNHQHSQLPDNNKKSKKVRCLYGAGDAQLPNLAQHVFHTRVKIAAGVLVAG